MWELTVPFSQFVVLVSDQDGHIRNGHTMHHSFNAEVDVLRPSHHLPKPVEKYMTLLCATYSHVSSPQEIHRKRVLKQVGA